MKEKPEKNVIKTSSSPCTNSDVVVQDGTLFLCGLSASKLCFQIGQILSDDLLDHLE